MKTNNILYFLLSLYLLFSSVAAYSQTATQNYVRTRTFTEADASEWLDYIQYFDGLGRSVQNVKCHYTPSRGSLVEMVEYDNFGRQSRIWLPARLYESDRYVNPTSVKTEARQYYQDQSPFSYTRYEDSPINKVLREYGPGQDWHSNGKAKKITYYTNSNTHSHLMCLNFKVNGTGTSAYLSKSGNYASNLLQVTEYKDEDGNTSYEFKDKLGQTVLTRQMNGTIQLDTYYVYDNAGNLCYVLPPMMIDAINNDAAGLGDAAGRMSMYSYIYKYDSRNRCIKKKLPGCDWESYVYDKADRLIFTQEANQAGTRSWMFSIPDELGRTVLTGVCTAANNTAISIGMYDSKLVKAEYTGQTVNRGYKLTVDGTTLTLTADPILAVYYYDNYDFLSLSDFSDLRYDTSKSEYRNRYGTDGDKSAAKGLLTGQSLYKLTNTVSASDRSAIVSPAALPIQSKYICSAFYYDYRGNLIQNLSTNTQYGLEKEYMKYNFTGQLTEKTHVHTVKEEDRTAGVLPYPIRTYTITEYYKNTYDHAGRLTKAQHKLNNGSLITLEDITYDEMDRVATRTPGATASLKSTYTYNVRSWTTRIAGDKFEQDIYYNTTNPNARNSNSKRYNGNITSMTWDVKDGKKAYNYTYDQLSRLTKADYYDNGSMQSDYYASYSYDKHGNVTFLQRSTYSTRPMDYMTIRYNGNQMQSVTETRANSNSSTIYEFKDYSGNTTNPQYRYAKNGAMIHDPYKGINISYHENQMPKRIDIPAIKGVIKYNYLADGTKTSALYQYNPNLSLNPLENTGSEANRTVTTYTQYMGNKVYKDNVKTHSIILLPNGYIKGNTYYFYIRDYQGNNRVIGSRTGSVAQRNHYYPYGLPMEKSTAHATQPYKYGDKEFDTMNGLNLYDFHARQYDGATTRFLTIDPHAENYYSTSPYAYCGNNPILRTDPTGMDWFVNNETGSLHFFKGVQALTDELKEKYGLTGNSYENLGSDNMFGDIVSYDGIDNILDLDSYSMGENSENFMSQQGYDKAERVNVIMEEHTISQADGRGGRNIKIGPNLSTPKKTGESQITYVKPQKIGEIISIKEIPINTGLVEIKAKEYHYQVIIGYGKGLNMKSNQLKPRINWKDINTSIKEGAYKKAYQKNQYIPPIYF